MKKIFTLVIACSSFVYANGQCMLGSTVADVTLQCSGGTGNRSGVAYNPTQQLYYSVDAGNPTYPIETFSVTGGSALSSTSQGADYRGFWWNASSNLPEGNTYNSGGVYANGLASSTYYATGTTTNSGPGTMPNAQSCGHANVAGNMIIYYDSGTLYKYNKSSGALITSTAVTGLPASTSNLNTYGVGYTGVTGAEAVLYDYVNKRAYFVNYTTGAYVSTCTFPSSAPTPASFMFGYANGRVFLFNSSLSQWYGYPVLNTAAGPTITASASSPSVCNGASVTLSASGASGYTWSAGGSGANVVVTPSANTIYTVVGTNTAGCFGSSTVGVLVNPGSSVTASQATAVCLGQSAVMSASGAVTYSWSNGMFGSAITVSPSSTTVYTVIGTNNLGCNTAATTTLNVMALPQVYAIATPTMLCVGSAATLVANGASTYTWNGGPSSATYVVNPTVTTTYSYTGTGGNGCDNEASITLYVNTNSLTITPPSTICAGNAFTLTASGAVSYQWSNGLPFNSITVLPTVTTVYMVNATDANGCALTASTQINVNQNPVVTAAPSKSIACKGDVITLTASGATSYSWSGVGSGAILTQTMTIDVPHSYTVTGTDNNGCAGVALVTVNVKKCTGMQENEAGNQVTIFPNPGGGVFTITLPNAAGYLIRVFDCTGRLVANQNVYGPASEVDISEFPRGVYLVEVSSPGVRAVSRVIKDR